MDLRWTGLFALALVANAPQPGRVLIGRYGGWAAFREGATCFAVALPRERAGGAEPPFLAFTRRVDAAVPVALFVRLSHPFESRAPVTLLAAGRTFVLRANSDGAFADSPREELRILAAVRAANRLEVRATGARGRAFGDVYDLAGAPSAIDAAILACGTR
ncbi:hypothetical protein [Sphingomonas nostoxanthinifaciens]|uniref:hypothetical protein n=1 Tax=Sphingomonas nostoxanthinifaciens TaxID=2872652 RepID=UPI001CC1D709|nr:hypothetical protein [Sphingomonas nostoxanthinifaciens]UAK24238.1 hypothetical protein K8P63_18220 [Sphingomonas nostoxanthinifaciens]